VPEITIRNANHADTGDIAAVAEAAGQDGEWSGTDPAYVAHLLRYGRMVVAEADGSVTGFGATRRLGTGTAAVSMLCDLFVHPAAHGQGLGRAMLAELWRDEPRRMTFSSLHPHALPLYTRFGLDAWWPLLYLAGEVSRVPAPAGLTVAPAAPELVGTAEQRWTGLDRLAEHRAWAARPNGQPVLVRRGREPLAAGTVAGAGAEFGLVHLAMPPGRPDDEARDVVLAVLAAAAGPAGRATVRLPGPHPAVRALLAAGWRRTDLDLFMASEPGLLDPRRAVPEPAAG
jgi:GNAT superfamily N-acetyltransferase